MALAPTLAEEKASSVISPGKTIRLRILKFNPKTDDKKKFIEYQVPYEKWTTVLDTILDAKKHLDHSIAVRYSCRQASCGSCGMIINGRPPFIRYLYQ